MCPQNMPYKGGPYGIKSLRGKGFLQKAWHTEPKNMAYDPPFMPYELFLLGVRAVFNLLIIGDPQSHIGVNAGLRAP